MIESPSTSTRNSSSDFGFSSGWRSPRELVVMTTSSMAQTVVGYRRPNVRMKPYAVIARPVDENIDPVFLVSLLHRDRPGAPGQGGLDFDDLLRRQDEACSTLRKEQGHHQRDDGETDLRRNSRRAFPIRVHVLSPHCAAFLFRNPSTVFGLRSIGPNERCPQFRRNRLRTLSRSLPRVSTRADNLR